MDSRQLACQLIRALRGRRSQPAFARRLGCNSNTIYSWESGRRFPSASRFLQVAARSGIDLKAALGLFLRALPPWLESLRAPFEGAAVQLLAELKGQRSLADVARATGKSRFRIARWFAGETEPRLPDFLELVQATSYRSLDFVAAFVDPARVPALAGEWVKLEAARQAAYTHPWCHAVLRLLETESWQARRKVTDRDIARALGIEPSVAARSLELLELTGQLIRTGPSWRVTDQSNVDLGGDPEPLKRLKAWAASIGLARIEAGAEGLYSYNLFCVSEADYLRLQELHRAYFRQLRALIAESTPSERVVMLNLQLFPLAGP